MECTFSVVKRGLSKVFHGKKSYKMTPQVKQVCLKTSKQYLCSEEMGELYEEKKNR